MHVDTDSDALHLQTALRDLIALSAIPATWTGREPPAVAAGLADSLVALLQLDFAFVRLTYPDRDGEVDVKRGSAWKRFPEWLQAYVARSQLSGRVIVTAAGDDSQTCRGFAIPIGIDGDGGLVAVGSRRSDFPTAIDQLLLSLAANHAATAFQNACLIDERRRTEEGLRAARDGLEMRVAERTAELERLADEQAALRHVATLVARGTGPQPVFQAVADEAEALFGADVSAIVRFEVDGSVTVMGAHWDRYIAGARLQLDPDYVLATVRATGRPARFDADYLAAADVPAFVREERIRSGLASPIVVDDELWGAITVAALHRSLPPDTETRLSQFAELMATAISNTEARVDLRRLVDEQAALRRVATLVAKEAPSAEVFEKVAEEAATVLGEADAGLLRDEGDGTGTVVANWGARARAAFPAGTRLPIDGDAATMVALRERRTVRIDDYSGVTASVGQSPERLGMRCAVGAPIVVRGRVWGALGAARYTDAEAFPAEAERRIAQLADLVATAIANAEARAEVERLADEQTALRRVATLVADGASSTAVFDAVAAEMAEILGADGVTLGRYEPGDEVAVIAQRRSDSGRTPLGTRVSHQGENVISLVRRSKKSVRMEHQAGAPGRLAALADDPGVRSSVGAPIVVNARLWGVTIATWRGDISPPADTEKRMAQFARLLDSAIANADSRAELIASRARLVAASDEARRRFERDLHDGVQQRLVSLGLELSGAEAIALGKDTELLARLAHVRQGLTGALDELRELSRGLHPAILAEGGLTPALRALARRSSVPVELHITVDERLPDQVEVGTYYIVSEALTNTSKHAQASEVEVEVHVDDRLRLMIVDDGVGGADPARGSGLTGLADRVSALGGTVSISSPPGVGTSLLVELPIASP